MKIANCNGKALFLAVRGHKPWRNMAQFGADQRLAETPYPTVGSGSLSALTVSQ